MTNEANLDWNTELNIKSDGNFYFPSMFNWFKFL